MASQRNERPVAFEEITLTDIGQDYFDRLRDLYAQTWRATYDGLLGSAVVSGMLDQLSGPSVGGMVPADSRVFGAVSQDGSLVGASIVREAGDVAYVWGLYVLPSCQRSGIGRRLMAAAIGSLHGARAVEVRVLKKSLGARAFYEALGFVVRREEDEEMFTGIVERLLVMAFVRP